MNRVLSKQLFSLIVIFVLASCGGDSSNDDQSAVGIPSPPAPIPDPEPKTKLTEIQASAFLNRATFGATRETIDALVASDVESWLEDQHEMPATLLLPYLQTLDVEDIRPNHRTQGWWFNAVNAPDQLRQRVAFALSEIFVASDRNGTLVNFQEGMADYYDMLVLNAFGNYRDLLEDVTLHPVMGVYLSMLGNEKPDLVNNIRPDENYAREVMQLFSIGLVELNSDGTEVTDGEGRGVPTYNQNVIEGFAHVFTGWTFAGSQFFRRPGQNPDFLSPMQAWQSFHDKGEKQLLNDVVVPANQNAEDDLAIALDNLFNHPNVGPFISYRLIQRLVTSNPSPAYVQRVAESFNNNGQGIRGDLWAVVKAILTDEEALNGAESLPNTFGKLREPLIRMAHQFRVTGAANAAGDIPFGQAINVIGQGPQSAPSVFNFFSPTYTQPGEISNANLVAPEFEITTANYLTGLNNSIIYFIYSLTSDDNPNRIELNLDTFIALADDHNALINELDVVYMAGQMSDSMRDALLDYLELIQSWAGAEMLVIEAMFLVLSSSEYAIQK